MLEEHRPVLVVVALDPVTVDAERGGVDEPTEGAHRVRVLLESVDVDPFALTLNVTQTVEVDDGKDHFLDQRTTKSR